jgi:hypothetical protein
VRATAATVANKKKKLKKNKVDYVNKKRKQLLLKMRQGLPIWYTQESMFIARDCFWDKGDVDQYKYLHAKWDAHFWEHVSDKDPCESTFAFLHLYCLGAYLERHIEALFPKIKRMVDRNFTLCLYKLARLALLKPRDPRCPNPGPGTGSDADKEEKHQTLMHFLREKTDFIDDEEILKDNGNPEYYHSYTPIWLVRTGLAHIGAKHFTGTWKDVNVHTQAMLERSRKSALANPLVHNARSPHPNSRYALSMRANAKARATLERRRKSALPKCVVKCVVAVLVGIAIALGILTMEAIASKQRRQ